MSAYVPRLYVHEDGRMVISVKIGEGHIHGLAFRWLLIAPDEQRWVEPGEFGDGFVEVAVWHPSMIQKAVPGRNW